MQRNEFIKTCGLACLGGALMPAFLGSCTSANYFAQATYSNNFLTVKKTEFIKTEKNKTTQRKYVLVKTEKLNFPVCVYKISEENYTALLMECTHKGCELQPNAGYLVCPCHGSEFSNTGVVQNPPAEQNLKTFKITTDNDTIYIQL